MTQERRSEIPKDFSPEEERERLTERFESNGSIEVISGCMYSGKTDELIARLDTVEVKLEIHVAQGHIEEETAEKVIRIFKPRIDTRYASDKIVSHSGSEMSAIVVDQENPEEIFENIDEFTLVVAIDEAQFFDERLLKVCDTLADRGVRVIVAGLDTNFRGETFGLMGDLIAKAEKKDQTTALCMKCGKAATRTQRVIVEMDEDEKEIRRPADYNDPIVLVGAKDFYEARCRKHHEVPGKPEESF